MSEKEPKKGAAPLRESDAAFIGAATAEWYRENKRDLPWRREVSAYRTLVSEIMLQQTRVEAVKPYFERFLKVFPTVEALAEADDERLMKCWQGLGYYSRARNLRRAAIEIVERYGGEIPRALPDLLSLPGIGPYTAGAIAAFAYGIPAPAVDGNVLRVMARVLGEEGDILSPAIKKRLTDAVSAAIPKDAASDFGQGLIELGATVCPPNAPPKCDLCPLYPLCRAAKEHTTDRIPYRKPKAKRRIEERTVLLIRTGDRVLLHRRPDRGLLAGLWELPSKSGKLSEKQALAAVRQLGLEPLRIKGTASAKHIFTHIEWHMIGYEIHIAEPDAALDAPYAFPLTAELHDAYALPSAFSPYLKLLK